VQFTKVFVVVCSDYCCPPVLQECGN